MTAFAVLVVLAILGVSAGTLRFYSLVINNQVLVRTMQSLYFIVTVLALNNAVHP